MIRRAAGSVLVLFGVLFAAWPSTARKPEPAGTIAVSAGEQVVLVQPSSGEVSALETGIVGWLYPAPGGLLFAPDLTRGRTAVIDLRRRYIERTLRWVTTPIFGTDPDRYAVVSDRVLVVSWPERSRLRSIDAGLERPWRTVLTPDGQFALVLERLPGADDHLVVVDLWQGLVTSRAALPGEVSDLALVPGPGVLAFASASSDAVVLSRPDASGVEERIALGDTPSSLAVAGGGDVLAVAGGDEGGGSLRLFRLERKKRKGLVTDAGAVVSFPAQVVRVAPSPDGAWVAVATATPEVAIVAVANGEVRARWPLTAQPRDVVWVDPALPGPLTPEWSDEVPDGELAPLWVE